MLTIPARLVAASRRTPAGRGWLERLPDTVNAMQSRWSLTLAPPFDSSEVSCAWVAPAVRRDGTRVVLKIGMPHLEATHELQGLRLWNGDPTVQLLDSDLELNAMLLERCEPGTSLRELPELEQDVVVAGLLRRLWRRPAPPHPFRPLAVMTAHWADETMTLADKWSDCSGLVNDGLQLLNELARSSPGDALLATDLHAGNVLRARREPWLVIDPKPFVGDRAYDATQHLFNCIGRVLNAPRPTIRRFAELLEVDSERVRLWMFARAAAEPRDSWNDDAFALARALV
jgi:streptomycin 6-kinase